MEENVDIQNSVALVTGANRGFGRHLAAELLSRGAKKVYAGARNPSTVDLPGVVPLQLDITDPASVEAAAKAAPDATLLINNAGISNHVALIDSDMAEIRLEMETNLFGTLDVTRAFAPVLAENGGGAILNVLSVLSWQHHPAYGAYCLAKAAGWAMTNVIRQELAGARIDVTGLMVGYMDTDMADYVDPSNKADPAVVARLALDGVQARALEVIGDDKAINALAGLSGGADQMYPGFPVAI
jgi:NAD(P)-dependent dehydrogenase (short-subunit alcohol dehydrogenase family)